MILTWTLYLAVTNLQKVRDAKGLTPPAERTGKGLLMLGLFCDFIFNLHNTIPFAELPREMLFTPRVSRHCKEPGWRGDLARWFCLNALDPFAKGEDHCGCHNTNPV
jgi:hypothetical protein